MTANDGGAVISVKDVFFKYPQSAEERGEDFALEDISLDIARGEFVAILGHNGSGKSTLAKLLNALLLPDSGVVTVNGLDTGVAENVWRVRQSAGMVFQNPDNQIIATVVEEDVAFGAENLGVPSDEIRARVDGALASLGMSSYAKSSPHLLSGGQKQRVAIAGILAMRPECIIFDEPTAMLDPKGRQEVMWAILSLKRDNGITVVLITHFMDEAVQADRVVLMDNGRIAGIGTPREVFSRVDELKAIGLDVPQATECSNELKKLGFNLPDGLIYVGEVEDALARILMKSKKGK